ncbi:MAG: DMT family transporter [Leptospirales bacterium]
MNHADPEEKKSLKWALVAAFLFGLSTPLSKPLAEIVSPLWLAGFFYAGSLLGIIPGFLPRLGMAPRSTREFFSLTALSRRETLALSASILIGGAIAPIFLIEGLTRFPASRGSLLLNGEAIFTVLIAHFLFRELMTGRLFVGVSLGSLGCGIVSLQETGNGFNGAFFFLAAAFLWALDTNLLRFLTGINPLVLTLWKGIGSSLILLPLAWKFAPAPPSGTIVLMALGVGGLGYGLSLVFFLRSIRILGVSRTGAWFGLSPFLGATLSILFLGEPLTTGFLMAAGVLLVAVLFLQDFGVPWKKWIRKSVGKS